MKGSDFLTKVYYFASCKNGYDRGHIIVRTNETESLIDRIHQALDLIGFDNDRIVHVSKDRHEFDEMEEKYLEETK